METPVSPLIDTHGRAARSNASGRYEASTRTAVADGWVQEDDGPPRVDTQLTAEHARHIITRNDSPDLGFDRTINPYRGCEHGCIYCYARPTHAYLGLSPGLDFETRLWFKPNAAELLERELSRPDYRPARIQLGASTDPYQPIERRLAITRAVLEVLARFRHPVSITTKGALVTRDIDILAPMARQGLVMVAMSVTTLDRALSRSMEPRASAPDRRIAAIAALHAAGVPVMAGVSPMIPGLNDHEMEAILDRVAAAGATRAYYTALRLPREVAVLFREWLAAEQPGRARRVMSLVRQMRSGKDYDSAWGTRMRGEGPVADLMEMRFRAACRRLGLDRRWAPLRTDLFAVPAKAGDQLRLL